MTDQELIRALRCCVSSPRLDKCREECVFCKGHDMANCIPQMGQAVADRLSSLVEDLERVTRERDAGWRICELRPSKAIWIATGVLGKQTGRNVIIAVLLTTGNGAARRRGEHG